MRPQGIIGVVLIALLVIASIMVGNFFFSTILGVDVDKLPAFLKFIVHLVGLGLIALAAKKLLLK